VSWEKPGSKLGCRAISAGGVFQLMYTSAKIVFVVNRYTFCNLSEDYGNVEFSFVQPKLHVWVRKV
jgi:hypothetical protein